MKAKGFAVFILFLFLCLFYSCGGGGGGGDSASNSPSTPSNPNPPKEEKPYGYVVVDRAKFFQTVDVIKRYTNVLVYLPFFINGEIILPRNWETTMVTREEMNHAVAAGFKKIILPNYFDGIDPAEEEEALRHFKEVISGYEEKVVVIVVDEPQVRGYTADMLRFMTQYVEEVVGVSTIINLAPPAVYPVSSGYLPGEVDIVAVDPYPCGMSISAIEDYLAENILLMQELAPGKPIILVSKSYWHAGQSASCQPTPELALANMRVTEQLGAGLLWFFYEEFYVENGRVLFGAKSFPDVLLSHQKMKP